MSRAEGIGFYAALVMIGVFAITHFDHEGAERRHQSVAIQLQAIAEAEANHSQSETIILTSRQQHYDDCLEGNKVRAGLSETVKQNQKTLPLFFRLLPQFDTAEVRKINNESVRRQLRDFAARDCVSYAEESVPANDRERISKIPLIKAPRKTGGEVGIAARPQHHAVR